MDQSPTRPFQFTLRQLLLLTVVCCVLSAGVYWLGAAFALLVIALAVVFGIPFALSRSLWGIKDWIVLVVVVVVLAALLLPALSVPRGPSRRGQCLNNLRNITLALQHYESIYGSFPPAYIADANGKPMHSWRVLILPFLERQDIYSQYRFDEPWNGPNNSKLHANYFRLFECPSDVGARGETSYVANGIKLRRKLLSQKCLF